MSTLYENIRFYCERAGISGAKLCTDTGISKSTLTSLKTGRTQKISTGNLEKMAVRLGITVNDLLGISEQQKKPTLETKSELNMDDVKLLLGKMSSADLVELMGDIAAKLKERGGE